MPARTSSLSSFKKYTWDEVRLHNSLADCWIVVEGKVYNVTSWVPLHPGGELIITGAGRESTALVYSYHPRYVSQQLLKQYLIGELVGYEHYYEWDSKFYSTMKQRVEQCIKEQHLTRDTYTMYSKSIFLLALWFFAYYLYIHYGHPLTAVLLGILHSQLGINIMHDGNHGAYSTSPLLATFAAHLMDYMGSSSIVWLHQHNIGHHPNSNNSDHTRNVESKPDPLAYDPDANGGFPFVRLNPDQPWRPYMRYQHIYIWFLITFTNFKWFISDFKSVINERYTHIDFFHITRTDKISLFITKSFFLFYALLVPLYTHGWFGFLLFALFLITAGYAFILMFSVNHLTEDSTFPNKKTPVNERDWAMLQVMTSSNFANESWFWTLVSGGLNFQIEHHLFPSLNHTHLPKISPIVKQTCKEFGVPYTSFPTFSSAVYSYYLHVKNLGNPKKNN